MISKISRRQLLKLGALAAGGLLASCAPKIVEVTKVVEKVVKETVVVEKAAAVPTAAPFVLELWSWGPMNPDNEPTKLYHDTMKKRFKDKYPLGDFKFRDMGWDEVLRQNLVTALLGGTPPDIIVGENFIQPYAEIGAFLPFDDVVADIKDNLIPGTYAAAVVKGKMYGVSYMTACFGFERNPNVIEKAGLDPDKPPETWSQLLEQAAAITKAGNGEYYGYTLQGPVGFLIGGILRFAVYHKVAKAEICKNDCTYPWYDNPGSERVLTLLRDLHKYTPPGLSFNPDEGQVYTQLFKGVSAYQICGAWHVKWAQDSGLTNAKYSWIPIPDQDGVKATGVVGNVILSVMSGTKQPQAALDLCKMALEDDIQDMIVTHQKWYPSTRSALKRWNDSTANEAEKMFIDMLLNADLGVLPQWRKEPNKLWTVYNDLITKLLQTNEPVKNLMAEAQQQADQIMQS